MILDLLVEFTRMFDLYRNAAMVKRVEDNHKEQLNIIQKNVVRVLRAIMHFRDHVCTIAEKESMKDASRSLQALGSLIPDKVKYLHFVDESEEAS